MKSEQILQALTHLSRSERFQIAREALQLIRDTEQHLTDTEREDLQTLIAEDINPVRHPSRLLAPDEVNAQLARSREQLEQAAQQAIEDYAVGSELTEPTDLDSEDFYDYDLEAHAS
ncbi:hypothetical protein [Baaleninema simplex]|uniref:hypothetical protein n=1 Tax=Baaleninema simplex TaxID=2862350 RepID=UPI0003478DB5|nr:hypothetical protein [Baaleninema simplex]